MFRRAPTPGASFVRPFAPLSQPPPAHQQLPQRPKSQLGAPRHVYGMTCAIRRLRHNRHGGLAELPYN